MGILRTPTFRLAWPYVFEKEKNAKGEDKYWSIVMLFDKSTDLSEMNDLALGVARVKWPKKFEGVAKGVWPKSIKHPPFRDGDEKSHVDGYAGTWWGKATTKIKKPQLVDRNGAPLSDQELVFPGTYAKAFVNAYTYDVDGSTGVNFGLYAVMILGGGERFGETIDATKLDWGTAEADQW